MSKGSKRRPTNSEKFNENFDKIKWSGETKYANRKRQGKVKSHNIMPDIEPYQTVGGDAPGTWITSRSKHREYLRRNNAIEVGNEKDYFFRYNGKTPDNPTRNWGEE